MKRKNGSKTTNEGEQSKKLKMKEEVIDLTNEEEQMNEEKKIQYFDSVPNELEIIMISFIVSEMKKNWKRDWNNISLVSKHWNSIAWISFQRTIPTSEKETIFIQACNKGRFHFMNKILTQDTTFDPSFQRNEAIKWATFYGFVDIVKLLLQDKRVDPSAENNYSIRRASELGHIVVVKLLLQDKRVDPSFKGNYAIINASANGRTDIVKLLLQDNRVDPSAKSNSAIIHASANGRTDVVKLLLQDERVDPSADNNFAIQYASKRGWLDIVKLLLQDKRVDPSAVRN